ncbi:MAG: response regulator [Myxococcales bacterium]|nr:response regulator [Myxococcales bacterium]
MSAPFSILFVDDDATILRMVKRVLAEEPYEVLTAPGPREALAILADREVDLLVSDIEMPDMDGLALIQIVRREHPETLRMLLTGNATMERALTAINEGEVLRFLTKPFEVAPFRRMLAGLAERLQTLRRDSAASSRAARREELRRWMAERFPGSTEVARNERGEVVIDLEGLTAAVLETGSAEARALLERER